MKWYLSPIIIGSVLIFAFVFYLVLLKMVMYLIIHLIFSSCLARMILESACSVYLYILIGISGIIFLFILFDKFILAKNK